MREMSDRHRPLLIDPCQEWPLVVHSKGEDPMLIGKSESGRIDGRISGRGGGF